MIRVEHDEQLEIPTIRFVSAHVVQVKRFMPLRIKHQVLYGHLLRDYFGLL